jgi:hypothetical protein
MLRFTVNCNCKCRKTVACDDTPIHDFPLILVDVPPINILYFVVCCWLAYHTHHKNY